MAGLWLPVGGLEVDDPGEGDLRWLLKGDWTTRAIPAFEPAPPAPSRRPVRVTVHAGGLTALDTGGALLLQRLVDAARAA